MMKKIIIVLALIVLIPVLAFLLLPTLVSNEQMRNALLSQVETATGLQITIDGDVSLGLFPTLAIEADRVEIASGLQGAGVNTVEAQQVRAGVAFLSLFGERMEISEIALISPRVQLVEAGQAGATSARSQAAGSQSGAQTGQTSGTGDQTGSASDGLAGAIEQLRRLSFARLIVEDGLVVDPAGQALVENIDLDVSLPDVDQDLIGDIAFTQAGQRYSTNVQTGALSRLLQGELTPVALNIVAEPPFHPNLEEIALNGNLQFNQQVLVLQGTTIEGGGLNGQVSGQIDLSRERPDINLRLVLDRVNVADWQTPANNTSSEPASAPAPTPEQTSGNQAASSVPASGAGSGKPDLSALAGFDLALNLTVQTLIVEGESYGPVQATLALENGQANIALQPLALAGGSVALQARSNLLEPGPLVLGNVIIDGASVSALAALAGQQAPLTGGLNANLDYGFEGLDPDAMLASLNARGTVALSNGAVEGQPISDLQTTLSITALDAPVRAQGSLNYQGQPARFDVTLSPQDFVQNGRGGIAGTLSAAGATVALDGQLDLAGSYGGAVNVTTPNLRQTLQSLNLGSGPSSALNLRSQVQASASTLTLSQMALQLGDLDLAGQATVGLGNVTSIQAQLSSQRLDLDSLMGIAGGGGSGAPAAAPSGGGVAGQNAPAPDSAIDTGGLRAIQADITLNAKAIRIGQALTGPAVLSVKADQGVITASSNRFALYGGQAELSARADGSGQGLGVNLSAELSNVDGRPFLAAASGFDKVDGRLNASVDVSGQGATQNSLLRSMNGQAAFRFADGALRGIDIAKIYNNLAAILAQGGQNVTQEGDRTAFTEFFANFAIQQGVASTQDITLNGPFVRMNGQGQTDLVTQELAFRLMPQLVRSVQGQGATQDVSGLGVPVLIGGTWSNPRIGPDLQSLLANPQATLQSLQQLGLPVDSLTKKLGITLPGGEGTGQPPRNVGEGARDVLRGVLQGDRPEDAVRNTLDSILGGQRGQQGQSAPAILPAEPQAVQPAPEAVPQEAAPQQQVQPVPQDQQNAPQDLTPPAEPQPQTEAPPQEEQGTTIEIPGGEIKLPFKF
jgi:AsmA protein